MHPLKGKRMASSTKKMMESVVEFIEVKTEQTKLRMIAWGARMLSGALALAVVGMLSFFFVFFLSFAFAAMINEGLGSTYLGFLIIAGGYLIVIGLMLLLVKAQRVQGWIEAIIVKMEEDRYEQKRND